MNHLYKIKIDYNVNEWCFIPGKKIALQINVQTITTSLVLQSIPFGLKDLVSFKKMNLFTLE